MPRHHAHDAVVARIERLVDIGGFSAADFAVPTSFYRAPSGKKLHSRRDCRKIRVASYSLVRHDGVIGVDTLDRCDCSLEHASGMLARRLDAAEAIVTLEHQAGALAANMSLVDVQTTQRVRRTAAQYQQDSWCQPRLDAAIDAADALLASDAATACVADAPRRVIRHCLLQVLFGVAPEDTVTTTNYSSARQYPNVDAGSTVDLLLREYSYSKHQVLAEAWAAFSNAVFADLSTADAVNVAIDRAAPALHPAPISISQVAHLAIDDLPTDEHRTVGDAITATWRRAALAATAELVRSWGSQLDLAFDAAVTANEMTVLAYEFDKDKDAKTARHAQVITEALAEFGPEPSGTQTVVCVPDVVADWVALRTKMASANSWGPQLLRRFVAHRPVPASAAAAATVIAARLLEDDNARKTEQLLCAAALTASIG